jgi:hypothetical protein
LDTYFNYWEDFWLLWVGNKAQAPSYTLSLVLVHIIWDAFNFSSKTSDHYWLYAVPSPITIWFQIMLPSSFWFTKIITLTMPMSFYQILLRLSIKKKCNLIILKYKCKRKISSLTHLIFWNMSIIVTYTFKCTHSHAHTTVLMFWILYLCKKTDLGMLYKQTLAIDNSRAYISKIVWVELLISKIFIQL